MFEEGRQRGVRQGKMCPQKVRLVISQSLIILCKSGIFKHCTRVFRRRSSGLLNPLARGGIVVLAWSGSGQRSEVKSQAV